MTCTDNIKNMIVQITEKIKSNYRPEKIILFGSYAHGTPGPDSDIDILIIKTTSDRPIDRRVLVRKITFDPNRRIPFEFIVLTPDEIQARLNIGDQFIEEIIKKGELLYAA
jgi:predicted nucleotidyltransferase